jgi:PAS domain S-box-containing protein
VLSKERTCPAGAPGSAPIGPVGSADRALSRPAAGADSYCVDLLDRDSRSRGRRTDLPFDWMFLAFGIFILACGATHAMEVWNLWHADYWLAGAIKAITAIASLLTAALLVRLVPHVVALPRPAALRIQIAERMRAEEALKLAKSELELRVEERTAELKKVNEDLVLQIDRRQTVEQHLRDSEEQLRLAQEASGVGVWDWDPRSDLVEWSDQTFRIFGLKPSERKLDESSVLKLIHPEDRAAVKLAIREALRPGGGYDAEYRIQRPDGSMRWVSCSHISTIVWCKCASGCCVQRSGPSANSRSTCPGSQPV